MSAEEKILAHLKAVNKPQRPGEIAEGTGLPKDEVSKVIKKLKQEGKVIVPKRCYYGLPES